jgi:hypothetical protein
VWNHVRFPVTRVSTAAVIAGLAPVTAAPQEFGVADDQ